MTMNREHRYRGQRIDNGEWVMGSLIRRGERFFIMPYNWSLTMSECQVSPETVGMYSVEIATDGRTICQGDILSIPSRYGDTFVVVGWTGCNFTVYNPYCCEVCAREDGCIEYLNEAMPQTEGYVHIVGNIHNNPNLIKPKE